MVYLEVYNMLYNDPAHYPGKTTRRRGEFSIYQLVTDGVLQPDRCPTPSFQTPPPAVLRAWSLCWEGDYTSRRWSRVGTEITVIGEFQSYEENGMTWYHLERKVGVIP